MEGARVMATPLKAADAFKDIGKGDMIALYRGKRITDCTREELLDIVVSLGRELQTSREHHLATLKIWDMARAQRGQG